MSSARRAGLWLLLGLLPGCQALHQAAVKQRLLQTRFFAHEVKPPLTEVDAFLLTRRQGAVRTWCELCLVSAKTHDDGSRTYCLLSREEQSCLRARPGAAGGTRFEPEPEEAGAFVSAQVVRALWNALELQAASDAEITTARELEDLARDEEEQFVPRWSFVAGAKTGAVISNDPPSFTFGGQAGFRYWGSLFVVPGAALEVETLVQSGRSFINLGTQARVELALWGDDNARYFNLPRVSFLISGGPLVGFGQRPSLGGRAVLGLHVIRVGRFVTPFFFELGFQALEVDEKSSTGLRVALGLGF